MIAHDRTRYLYHRVPTGLVGDELVPLSRLKQLSPQAYDEAAAKYVGREATMERQIPGLHCLWNDVLFFAAAHPAELTRLYENIIGPAARRRFFVVDPSLLDGPVRVWLFDRDPPHHHRPESYVHFDAGKMDEYAKIPPETGRYYAQSVREGRQPLLWWRVPHILYQGTLPWRQLPVIEA